VEKPTVSYRLDERREVTVFKNEFCNSRGEAMLWITLALLSAYLILFVILVKTGMQNNLRVGGGVTKGIPALSVPSFRQSERLIAQELARSRRYHHPFSLVVLGLDGEETRDDDDSLQERMRQLAFGLVGPAWRDGLRRSDLVTFDPRRNRYVVLLAESDRLQAERCIERLLQDSLERPIPGLRIGVAQFPDESTTLEDLLKWAEQSPVEGFGVPIRGQAEPTPVSLAARRQVREGA